MLYYTMYNYIYELSTTLILTYPYFFLLILTLTPYFDVINSNIRMGICCCFWYLVKSFTEITEDR